MKWSYSKKVEADRLISIDVVELKRIGYLPINYDQRSNNLSYGNNRFNVNISVKESDNESSLNFSYQYKSSQYSYSYPLTTTSCNFGGQRYWIQCNMKTAHGVCNRRVGKLYFMSGYFACRHCHNLTYSTQLEDRKSGFYPIYKGLLKYKQSLEAREKVTRIYYAGKFTRKMRNYLRLREESNQYYNSYLEH